NTLFLGKHSGKHAFKDKVKEFGVEMTDEEVKSTFKRFKELTDHKSEVTDDDSYTLIMETKTAHSAVNQYSLENFQVNYGTANITTATVSLSTPDGETVQTAATGMRRVEALYTTIQELTA